MEVGGILARGGAVSSNLLKQGQPGERLWVEVVQKTSEGVGTIRVKGLDVSALLEPSTKVGDQFWVKVGNLNEGSLMLIREPLVEKQGKMQLAPLQSKQVTERGLPVNQEIISLLKTFTIEKPGIFSALLTSLQDTPFDGLIANLRKSSPKWEGLSEENGAEVLLESLRKLGLDYEQRIQHLMTLDPEAKETEKSSLKETFKFALLQSLQNQETLEHHSQEMVKKLLENLTGQ